mgnify:CR=1 FL=1
MDKDFRCPTFPEVLAATLALLPRGRAWQTRDGGPHPGSEIAFEPAAFDNEAFQTARRRPSVLWQFWAAVADVFTFVNQRLCDLRWEFWCATTNEQRDGWLKEYGLPDACDPFPDLCLKVAAIGGTRCEYYAVVAARAGWSIACIDSGHCGTRVGSRRSKAGRMKPGATRGARITILVDLDSSPAFVGNRFAKAKAGRLKAGRRLACGPDMRVLECLLSRVIHAEIEVKYEAF